MPRQRGEAAEGWIALADPAIPLAFDGSVAQQLGRKGRDQPGTLDEQAAALQTAVFAAAAQHLHSTAATARKPWVSERALKLICARSAARLAGQHAEERRLNKQVRAAVKQDRAKWLDELVVADLRGAARRLQRLAGAGANCPHDPAREGASGEEWADTLAQHFATAWAGQPAPNDSAWSGERWPQPVA